jgi:hypothetical protein
LGFDLSAAAPAVATFLLTAISAVLRGAELGRTKRREQGHAEGAQPAQGAAAIPRAGEVSQRLIKLILRCSELVLLRYTSGRRVRRSLL